MSHTTSNTNCVCAGITPSSSLAEISTTLEMAGRDLSTQSYFKPTASSGKNRQRHFLQKKIKNRGCGLQGDELMSYQLMGDFKTAVVNKALNSIQKYKVFIFMDI